MMHDYSALVQAHRALAAAILDDPFTSVAIAANNIIKGLVINKSQITAAADVLQQPRSTEEERLAAVNLLGRYLERYATKFDNNM